MQRERSLSDQFNSDREKIQNLESKLMKQLEVIFKPQETSQIQTCIDQNNCEKPGFDKQEK